MLSFALHVARTGEELCLEESQGRVTIHAYSSMPFLLLEQLPSRNQVMRREILQLSCKAQKKRGEHIMLKGRWKE